MFERIDRAVGRIYAAIGALVGLTIGGFAVGISLDLLLRLLEWGNIPGLQEVIEYLLFAGVFLAAPWVLRLYAHVRVDLLVSNLPGRLTAAMERALDVFGLAVCLTLVWFGWANLSSAWMFQSMQMKYFQMPEWALLAVFVACFVLLAVEFVFRLIRSGAPPKAGAESGKGL
ncbi:MAG: TRAP transporter small permease [Minwuia sp.]|uniref:TRAP transporter small permease n=1 Tax=Minwuia sp. TaxID=2493630 RepID=UPI003A8C2B81